MSCETEINTNIEILIKPNENSQPNKSKVVNLDENSSETLTECFDRMNVEPDLKMEQDVEPDLKMGPDVEPDLKMGPDVKPDLNIDVEPKRKVLVLDLDETLAHTKYGQKYRDPEKKYKIPQSENPPNFVFTVSLS